MTIFNRFYFAEYEEICELQVESNSVKIANHKIKPEQAEAAVNSESVSADVTFHGISLDSEITDEGLYDDGYEMTVPKINVNHKKQKNDVPLKSSSLNNEHPPCSHKRDIVPYAITPEGPISQGPEPSLNSLEGDFDMSIFDSSQAATGNSEEQSEIEEICVEGYKPIAGQTVTRNTQDYNIDKMGDLADEHIENDDLCDNNVVLTQRHGGCTKESTGAKRGNNEPIYSWSNSNVYQRLNRATMESYDCALSEVDIISNINSAPSDSSANWKEILSTPALPNTTMLLFSPNVYPCGYQD